MIDWDASFIVYEIVCLENDKRYIGQTTQKGKYRKKDHIRQLDNKTHYNTYLQNSWNKYGKDNFSFQILAKCDNIEELNFLEEFFIELFDTYNNGYNLALDGNNYEHLKERVFTEEHKRKISKANKGRKTPKVIREKLSRIHKEIGSVPPKQDKEILQLDLENNIINEFSSIRKAAKQLDLYESNISSVCRGKRKTTGGYKFEFKKRKYAS